MKVFVKGNLVQEFRNAASAQKASVLLATKQALERATPVDTGEARDGWKLTERGIENDVEHISYLNEGHSPQADANFIERTVLSVPGIKPNGTIVRLK